MLISTFKSLVRTTCGTISATTFCSLALLTATSQNVEAKVVVGLPDVIEISVQHLSDVQNQLRQGLGISWGPQKTSVEHVKVGDQVVQVTLTRVFSVSSYPYIELIQASPQIGPWAPFNDAVVGQAPRFSLVWRVADSEFEKLSMQMSDVGLKNTARGVDFVYYEAIAGVQLEIVRDNVAPNPANGIPNTPPPGKKDFGAMGYFSIPLQVAPVNPDTWIPVDDFILRKQISEATGEGITWDINEPLTTLFPYVLDKDPTNPQLAGNPCLVNSCNAYQFPFLDTVVISPVISPLFGATCNSTAFSPAWVIPGSGLDPIGAAVMTSYEQQLVEAGFQSVIRLDAQTLGVTPYEADILRYFAGIDNVNIQVVNAFVAPVATSSCTDHCGASTGKTSNRSLLVK